MMTPFERRVISLHRQYPDDGLLRRLAHDVIVSLARRHRR